MEDVINVKQVTYFAIDRTNVKESMEEFDVTPFKVQVLEDMKKMMEKLDINNDREVYDEADGLFTATMESIIVPISSHGSANPYTIMTKHFERFFHSVIEDHPFFKILFDTVFHTVKRRRHEDCEELIDKNYVEICMANNFNYLSKVKVDLVGTATDAYVAIGDDFGNLFGGNRDTENWLSQLLSNVCRDIAAMLPYLNPDDMAFNMDYVAFCVAMNNKYRYEAGIVFADEDIYLPLEEMGVCIPPESYRIYDAGGLILREKMLLFDHDNGLYEHFVNLIKLVQSSNALLMPCVVDVVRKGVRKLSEEYDPSNPYKTLIGLTNLSDFRVAVFEIENEYDLEILSSYAGRLMFAGNYNMSPGGDFFIGEDDRGLKEMAECLKSIGATDIIGCYIGEPVFHFPCLYVLYYDRTRLHRTLSYNKEG